MSTKQKTQVLTASAIPHEVESLIDYALPAVEGAPTVADAKYRAIFRLNNGESEESEISPRVLISDVLSGQALTDFQNAIEQLQAAAFAASNFTDP